MGRNVSVAKSLADAAKRGKSRLSKHQGSYEAQTAMSRLARIGEKLRKDLNKPIDSKRINTNIPLVNERPCFDKLIEHEIAEELSSFGLSGRQLETAVAAVAQRVSVTLEVARSDLFSNTSFIDPTTSLKLPPDPPDRPFSQHVKTYGKRLSIRDYARAQWPGHFLKARLFVEHLISVDNSLYQACRYRAREENLEFYEYCKQAGILSRRIVEREPERYRDQLQLLKILDLRVKGAGRWRNASQMLQELTERA